MNQKKQTNIATLEGARTLAHVSGNGHHPLNDGNGQHDQPEASAAEAPGITIYGIEIPGNTTGDDAEIFLLENLKLFTDLEDAELELAAIKLRKQLHLSKGFTEKWIGHVKRARPEESEEVEVAQADQPVQSEANKATTPAGEDKEPTPIEELSEVDQFLVKTSATDYGNALCVQKLFGDRFAHNEAFGLMFYDGKRWTHQNAQAKLSDAVIRTLKRRGKFSFDYDKPELTKKSVLNNANINNCEARFLELPELYKPVGQFDAHLHLLNCNNGVVNLRTGELLKHDPKYLITHITSVDYVPDASQASWLSFMATVIGNYRDYAVSDYIQMAGGYSATGETTEHALFYLFGEKGRNGKGVYVDVLKAAMGDYAGGCQFNTLTRSRENGDQGFDIAALRGLRLVVTSESSKDDKLNEAAVKYLTGEDELQVAHKGKDPFSFKPAFKIWALSNHEPKGDVDDDSFWDRLKIVEFPNSFRGNEDKSLRKRLTSPAVLEGVLAWIVEGAVMWYASGSAGLQSPDQVRKHGQDIRDAQDSVRSWVKNDCIVEDEIKFCSNKDLFDSYTRWCRENEREDEKGQDSMGKRLAKMDFKRGLSGTGNNRNRGFVGIRPKTPVERGDFREN